MYNRIELSLEKSLVGVIYVGGKRSTAAAVVDKCGVGRTHRLAIVVIVGFLELSDILSCHANFIKFIMAIIHTHRICQLGCTPRIETLSMTERWCDKENTTLDGKWQRQYLVDYPEPVRCQSVVVAPGEWWWPSSFNAHSLRVIHHSLVDRQGPRTLVQVCNIGLFVRNLFVN